MIPKIIHYCWFGESKKSQLINDCIASWKKFCPDYELIEWNESNYDITKNNYMYQAYKSKKWGFVPDYARKDIIYRYGGIYLDTDVELIRPIDDLLNNEAFFGMENPGKVALGLGFGAEKENEMIKELLSVYDDVNFINSDGTINTTACVEYDMSVFSKYGIKETNDHQYAGNAHIYPTEYFAPKRGYQTETMLTENTYSIHHYCFSWGSSSQKLRGKAYRWLSRNIGPKNANKIRNIIGKKNSV